jgi:hypothetical protein
MYIGGRVVITLVVVVRSIMNLPISQSEPIGRIFVFRALLQGSISGRQEIMEIPVAAYDFEQAMENLQRAYPQLEPIIDEMRIQKAIGEIHEPPNYV